VPKLLALLSLRGTVVSADALICQRAIAQQIINEGGDYALAPKGAQVTLHDEVSRYLDDPTCIAQTATPGADAGHRRIDVQVPVQDKRSERVAAGYIRGRRMGQPLSRPIIGRPLKCDHPEGVSPFGVWRTPSSG
jgi:hypothetical protein